MFNKHKAFPVNIMFAHISKIELPPFGTSKTERKLTK